MMTLSQACKATFLIGSLALLAAAPGHANDKCGNHKNAYEKGMKDGHKDAANYRSSDSRAGEDKVAKDGRHCYTMGYEEAYTKEARKQINSDSGSHGSHHNGGNHHSSGMEYEEEYYDLGCRKGRRDAEARMSMAYERHDGDYDSRFESAYQDGYERCWKESR